MGLLKVLQYLFLPETEVSPSSKFEPRKEAVIQKNKRRRSIADVKKDEYIIAYWHRQTSNNGIGTFRCISNDPETKKILLEKRWSNFKDLDIPEYEKVIFSYDSEAFYDFNLLNPEVKEKKPVESIAINKLQQKVKEAIKNEDWKRVDELDEEIKKCGNRAPEL